MSVSERLKLKNHLDVLKKRQNIVKQCLSKMAKMGGFGGLNVKIKVHFSN